MVLGGPVACCYIFFITAIICGTGWTGEVVLPVNLKKEIAAQKEFVDKLKEHILKGEGRHETYNRLGNLTDRFGYRLAGSQVLEDAIDAVKEQMEADGLENVHTENVTIPDWRRKNEFAQLLLPRNHIMRILGLGGSVPTNSSGIEAECIVVKTFEELDKVAHKVKGRIVVYNQAYKGYGYSVQYRGMGAVRAEKYGAVAVLVRSVTPLSVYSPHTGATSSKGTIPAASITVEDAEMLNRMQARGQTIRILLKMDSGTQGNTTSRNLIAEIKGSKYPEQVVVISGHWDSWDVGQGAMDDGGGSLISWMALALVKRLKYRPKRTLRAVLWTAEEIGLHGGRQYYERHKNEAVNMSIIMESDAGTFSPLGIGFTGTDSARAIIREILQHADSLNASQVGPRGGGPDIGWWIRNEKVPGGYLMNSNENYFIYHHTAGDTMTVEDPDELDRCTLVWAIVSYILADLENMLPRDNPFPTAGPINGVTSDLHNMNTALYLLTSLICIRYYWRSDPVYN